MTHRYTVIRIFFQSVVVSRLINDNYSAVVTGSKLLCWIGSKSSVASETPCLRLRRRWIKTDSGSVHCTNFKTTFFCTNPVTEFCKEYLFAKNCVQKPQVILESLGHLEVQNSLVSSLSVFLRIEQIIPTLIKRNSGHLFTHCVRTDMNGSYLLSQPGCDCAFSWTRKSAEHSAKNRFWTTVFTV